MASHFDNPAQWRLRNNNGTVPFKLVDVEGEFEAESASVTLHGMIPSNQIVTFLEETFPPPIPVGNMMVPQSVPLPGLPGLTCRRVKFSSQDKSKPVDPFGFDPTAPAGTYHPVLSVDMDYGMNRIRDPDPNDPFTFLEISADASGEVFWTTAPGGRWQKKEEDPANKPDAEPPQKPGDPQQGTGVNKRVDPVKDPTVPIVISVPLTEWTVRWNAVPFLYFRDVLIYRIRWCLGRVNNDFLPLLFGASPETVLFTGYNVRQQFTWRAGQIGSPPMNVELKFLEKHVVWNGVIRGHNDIWRPGIGWEYLLLDGTNPTFQSRPMGTLLKV